MRVLRDMNLSKLVGADEPLFMSLLDDLFPGLTLDKGGYPQLEEAINQHLSESKLVSHPPWLLKVIQLYETQRVRHGMMVLGPSGTGKTCCIHTLMKAMSQCFEPHREMRMNPKAITVAQMFGKLDVATNDWTDGIFSTLWRRTLKWKKSEHVWLVLDGPVDALWIENLNSVLDDSKLLTLANGDRIPMSPTCKIMFEVDNIDNATPATVSRNAEADQLLQLFTTSFPLVYQYASRHLVFKTKTLEAFVVRQACDILTGIMPEREEKESSTQVVCPYLERLYVFAIMWSIGALLEEDDRAKFDAYIRQHETIRLDLPPIDANTSDSVFDFLVSDNGNWTHWSSRVEQFVYPANGTPEYSSLLVPNVDNVRTEFLIDVIAKQLKSVMLIGEQAMSQCFEPHREMRMNPKAITVAQMFGKLDVATNDWTDGIFSTLWRRTLKWKKSEHVWLVLDGPVDALWIENLNSVLDDSKLLTLANGDRIPMSPTCKIMFEVDNIDNATPATVSRNETGGFYNLQKPGDFTTIVDMQFLAAMVHSGAGRNDIPERLKKQFCIFNCTLPSQNSIDKIFGPIALGHYGHSRGFSEEVTRLVARLVPVTRIVWQVTKGKMLPTPSKFHYVFNLRDLSRIWQAMTSTVSEVLNSPNRLLLLWRHECLRVLSDRDPPEPTGDEPDDYIIEAPRIYEPVSVCYLYKTDFPFLTAGLCVMMKSYNVNNLLDDLKVLYRTAGLKGKGITFLFTDQEVKDEAFLEYLNNMLSSGIISNLFTREEMDEICQELIPTMKKEFPRRPLTNENLRAYFYSRTKQHLHISLCFSPVEEKFRTRALKFPGLFSGCTIIWFHRWPRDALVAVADHYLQSFQMVCSTTTKIEVINAMGIIHDGVAESCSDYFLRYRRQTHVTPKSYLSFLMSYKTVYKQQYDYFAGLAERMNGGLKKLAEAQESVSELSKELAVKERELEVANKEAEKVLQTVSFSEYILQCHSD
ncbi:hypothetical protein AHF37_07206 [Paragonimus kellicotti]|nr:hypothetical protein AHF37_07206 [Paragonimus kellicotti]